MGVGRGRDEADGGDVADLGVEFLFKSWASVYLKPELKLVTKGVAMTDLA